MKTVTLSIRVDPQLVEGLQEFEIKTGIERASLVRASVKAALDHFSETGSIIFPIKITDSGPGKNSAGSATNGSLPAESSKGKVA